MSESVSAPLRVVPPSPWQLAADSAAPFVAWFAADAPTVLRRAAQAGLEVAAVDGSARVVASREGLARLSSRLDGTAAGSALARFLAPVAAWKLRTRELPLDRCYVMGIVNLTQDSFSGDGVGASIDAALRRAGELRQAGADIIDVGGETARADRPVVDAEAEAALAGPAIAALVREGHIVSSDTYKPLVARAALESGAEIVNDISGLTLGTGAAEEAARAGAGYVLNYSYSVPKRRPDSPPVYADVVSETVAWMFGRVAMLRAAGFDDGQVAIDPGIAFGKSHEEDLQLLRRLGELTSLGLPVLLAHSRKNFIGSVTGREPTDRDPETHLVSAFAAVQGARIFRVHDAAGARRVLEMAQALVAAPGGAYAPDAESWPWRSGASAAHMTGLAADKAAPSGQRW